MSAKLWPTYIPAFRGQKLFCLQDQGLDWRFDPGEACLSPQASWQLPQSIARQTHWPVMIWLCHMTINPGLFAKKRPSVLLPRRTQPLLLLIMLLLVLPSFCYPSRCLLFLVCFAVAAAVI